MLKPQPISEPLGLVREVERHHEHVRDALVPFALEMVLGEPEGVVPAPVEQARQVARLGEGGDEVLVREDAAVHGGAAVADVVHVHVAGVQAVELGDHVASFLSRAAAGIRHAPLSCRFRSASRIASRSSPAPCGRNGHTLGARRARAGLRCCEEASFPLCAG